MQWALLASALQQKLAVTGDNVISCTAKAVAAHHKPRQGRLQMACEGKAAGEARCQIAAGRLMPSHSYNQCRCWKCSKLMEGSSLGPAQS